MGYFAKKMMPVLIITAAALYGCWRRFLGGNRMDSCKVDDTSKENSCKLVDETSPSLAVEVSFCDLPDEVLSYILSLLSLRDVARMATLSRNLRKLCLSLPSLSLDWVIMSNYHTNWPWHGEESCGPYRSAYVNSVNQVLQNYRDQKILSFSLVCCLKNKCASDVNRWFSFVAASNCLQRLTLKFICVDGWSGFFRCKYDELPLICGSFLSQFSYLKELHLSDCVLKLDNELKLTNLTTLDLNNVFLEGTHWQGMFSISSKIESLLLSECTLPNKLCIGDNFPHLRHLYIGGCSNLQELELSARNLNNFDLHTREPLKCSFINVSNLKQVYFFPRCSGKEILDNLAVNAFTLEYLDLRGVYPMIQKLPFCPTRLFHSVLRLRIFIRNDDGYIVTSLPGLLKSFPLLKKLVLELSSEPECQTSKLPVLRVHTKLMEVQLSNFHVKYIPIAIYLLKSAVMLERMVLTKSSWFVNGFQPWGGGLYTAPYSNKERNKERKVIQKALVGKAFSTGVEVIIQ